MTPAAVIVILGFALPNAPSTNAPAALGPGIDAQPDSMATIPVYWFPPVVVDAPRPIAPQSAAATIRVEVDSLALPAAPTLETVLREVPLLHIRTNSRGEAEISVRGSESRQTAVIVDGIPITLAWDNRADVSVIAATAFREVEFVRGAPSMLHGPNVTGGILDVRLARSLVQPESSSLQLALAVDHVGSVGATARTALPLKGSRGAWLLQGGVGFRDTPGTPLAGGVEERLPTNDDLRLNTDARGFDGFLGVRYRAEGGAWGSLSGLSFGAERGIPAELGVPDEDARFWRYPHVSRTLLLASGGTGQRASPLGGRAGLELNLGFDTGRTEIDAFTSPAYDTVDSFENGDGRIWTTRLLADQSLGGRADLRGSFTAADIRHDESTPDGTFRYRQRLWSAGLEGAWHPLRSRGFVQDLTLSAGGAYDVAETPEAGGKKPLARLDDWGARIGISMILTDDRTAIHAGLSRRGRFPSLRELYSGAQNRFVPNPNLRPEGTVTSELGATTRQGPVTVQTTFFHTRVHDVVVRTLLEDGRFLRVNRDALRTFGIEGLASYDRGPLAISGQFVLQDVALEDPEAGRTREAENLPEFTAGVDARAPLALGITLGIGLQHTGTQYAIDPTTGEDAALEAATILGADLTRVWVLHPRNTRAVPTRLTTRIAADNLTDARLDDQFGLPRPGRTVRFEIRLD